MTRRDPSFDLVWEVESPVGPDLTAFHDHLCSARETATTVLVPDNHTARATVSSIAVARRVNDAGTHPSPRVSVTTRLAPIPTWKLAADRLFVQVSYDLDPLLRWRETIDFDGPVVPAVIVLPSAAMARSLAARIPELRPPDRWIAAVAADPLAGVELAVDLAERIRASGAFAGVHLIAGRRHHEVATQLSPFATHPHPRARVPAPA